MPTNDIPQLPADVARCTQALCPATASCLRFHSPPHAERQVYLIVSAKELTAEGCDIRIPMPKGAPDDE